MIFIYLGGGRSQLWLTLLGLFVTVVFNSGLLSSPASYPIRPSTVRGGCFAANSKAAASRLRHGAATTVPTVSQVEWPVTADPWEPRVTSSLWLTLLVPGFGLLALVGCKAYYSMRQQVLHAAGMHMSIALQHATLLLIWMQIAI